MRNRPLTNETICATIAVALGRNGTGPIEPAMDLRRDLGVDSVGLMSVVYVLDEQTTVDMFDHVDELARAEFVSDIIDVIRQAER